MEGIEEFEEMMMLVKTIDVQFYERATIRQGRSGGMNFRAQLCLVETRLAGRLELRPPIVLICLASDKKFFLRQVQLAEFLPIFHFLFQKITMTGEKIVGLVEVSLHNFPTFFRWRDGERSDGVDEGEMAVLVELHLFGHHNRMLIGRWVGEAQAVVGSC